MKLLETLFRSFLRDRRANVAMMGALSLPPALLLTAIAPATWGTTYLVTTHLLPPGHPLFAGLMRTLPAGLLALMITRQLPRGSWWWRSLVLGGLNMGAFFPLLFVAAQCLPGGVAATLGAVRRASSAAGPLGESELRAIAARDTVRGRSVMAPVAGVAAGVAPGGALLVRDPQGALHEVRQTTVTFA